MIDVRTYGAKADGTTDCSGAINAAIIVDDIILQNGIFLISESIKIPSNRTIYGKNAKVKMANGAYDNFARNSDFAGGNINIKITGLGNFIFDGNTINNIEVNPFNDAGDYTKYGLTAEESYKYLGFVFNNVDVLEVTDIIISDRPHYIAYNARVTNAVFQNLYFDYKLLTLNQDGIAFVWGCHDIVVNNIRGYCGDDFFSFDAGDRGNFMDSSLFHSAYTIGDVYNIDFDNIKVFRGLYQLFIIICGDGNKVHDISFDDVLINYCSAVLYSGYTSFRTVAPAKEDIQDITVDNIHVKTQRASWRAAFSLGENCQDITITNYTNDSDEPDFEESGGLDIVNFTINGTSYPIT